MIPMFMFFPNSTTSGTPYVGGDWVLSTDYASLALAVATGKHVIIPPNTTEVVSTAAGTYSGGNLARIKLDVGQQIIGGDKHTSIIQIDGNGRGIQLSSKSAIYNTKLVGVNGSGYQVGICTYDIDFNIEGNIFTGFQGTDNAGQGGGAIQFIGNPGVDYKRGASVLNNVFDSNVTGLNIMEAAEFIRFFNNNFFNNGTGIVNRGGNNTFTTGVMVGNTLAFSLQDGSNDGHGSISDYRINHNTTNLKINDQALGFSITNVHCYDGHIEITNSNDICFGNCHLKGYPGNNLTLTSNTANGVRIDGLTKYDAASYNKVLTGPDLVIV